jgi:voltage-gated potassium channel Kch
MARWRAEVIRRIARWRAFWRMTDPHFAAAVVVATALVLGYIGLAQYVPHQPASAGYGDSWDEILFYDLQLYFLSAAPAAGRGPFPVLLAIARFLAPVGTVLVTLVGVRLVLADQLRRYNAKYSRGHAIVVGNGSVALALARNLGKGGKGGGGKVVIVSTSDDTLTQARRYDILTVRGDPSEGATLTAAGVAWADELYACASDDDVFTNMNIALAAGQSTSGRKQPLSAFALIPSAELAVGLRGQLLAASGVLRGLNLDYFTLEDIAARKLLDRFPLAWDGPHIVIIGLGPFGQAILRETARRSPALRGGPRAEVFIQGVAEPDVVQVIGAFPAIGYGCSITQTGQYTVFVCLDDYDDALREGMDAARRDGSNRGHVVICVRELVPFASAYARYPWTVKDLENTISVFGIREEACSPAVIRGSAFIGWLARAIHGDYVSRSRARGETPMANPSMVAWSRLSEDLREANIGQPAGIGAKMASINAVVVPQSAAAPEFRFTDGEIQLLAELEHERWMRERIDRGWRYGDRRDNRRKTHPGLVSWAVLPESARENERDIVRAIPGILYDAGYQIFRLPPNR